MRHARGRIHASQVRHCGFELEVEANGGCGLMEQFVRAWVRPIPTAARSCDAVTPVIPNGYPRWQSRIRGARLRALVGTHDEQPGRQPTELRWVGVLPAHRSVCRRLRPLVSGVVSQAMPGGGASRRLLARLMRLVCLPSVGRQGRWGCCTLRLAGRLVGLVAGRGRLILEGVVVPAWTLSAMISCCCWEVGCGPRPGGRWPPSGSPRRSQLPTRSWAPGWS